MVSKKEARNLVENLPILNSLEEIEQALLTGRNRQLNFINPVLFFGAMRDKRLQNLLLSSTSLNIIDSALVLFICRLLGKRYQRIPGPDVFKKLVLNSDKDVFLLGSTREVVKELTEGFPNRRLVGATLPFIEHYEDFDYSKVVTDISNYRIIAVSLGAPKQELFSATLLSKTSDKVILNVGAAFDFYGDVRRSRAPRIFTALYLEWLVRLAKEPTRMLPRVKNVLRDSIFLLLR